MKISFESGMNDDGSERAKPLASVFLAQRKWIILCASFVYLVSHGWLSIDQKWLAFQFNISNTSTYLLKTVAFSGILFTAYMWSTAYAFRKTHKLEQRRRFDELNIEERDIFSSRIEELESAEVNIQDQISNRTSQLRELDQELSTWETRVVELQTFQEEKLRLGTNAVPQSVLPYLREATAGKAMNAFADYGTYSHEDITLALRSAKDSRNQAKERFATLLGSLESIRTEALGLQKEIAAAESERSMILAANNSEWNKFYRGRIISDSLACVPSILAGLYCAVFLLFGNINLLNLFEGLSQPSTSGTFAPH